MVDDGFGHVQPHPEFPRLTLAPSAYHSTSLGAVREMLRNEPDALVTEDRSGIIEITIGDVAKTLLTTRIARVTLEPSARWRQSKPLRTPAKWRRKCAGLTFSFRAHTSSTELLYRLGTNDGLTFHKHLKT